MASDDTLIVWSPLHYEPRTNTAATIDLRNAHPVLDFDASTDEYARFSAVMPQAYSSGGVTVKYHVAFSSAATGTASVAGAWERLGARVQDMDSDSFATQKEIAIGAPGTAGVLAIGTCTFAHGSQMDSILAGDGFRFETMRSTGSSVDNASGDLEIRFVEVRET